MRNRCSLRRRPAISNILGSLMVLAIVASIGSVILFQGLDQITAFNYDLSVFDTAKNDKLKEDLIFQHVRFIPGTTNVELYIANIGSVESSISTVTMVHTDSQELVLKWAPSNSTIQIDNSDILLMTAELSCPFPQCQNGDDWNDNFYNQTEYKISVTTSRGNFFSTVASPWNT